MVSKRIRWYIFYMLFLCTFLSCLGVGPFYSAPMASADRDSAAKKFDLVPGIAVVFIYRRGDRASWARTPILIDGKEIAHMVPSTFVQVELTPGFHKIQVKTERLQKGNYQQYSNIETMPENDLTLTIQAKPGLNMFIRLLPVKKDQLCFQPELVNDDKGQEEIKMTKLLEITRHSQE